MASFALSFIRGFFRFIDGLAPRAAGRLAFALFQRPPRAKRPVGPGRGEQQQFLATGRRHVIDSPAGQVVAREFGVDRASAPPVLVLHGWGSHSGHMVPVIRAVRASGRTAIALDLPAHGESAGRTLNMVTAVRAVEAVARQFGPFDAVVGHSFGGAVALNAACGSIPGVKALDANRLVMIAAPSSIPTLFEGFGRMLGLGPRTQTVLVRRVEELAGRPLEAFVGAEQLAGLKLATLVAHAPDDKEVAFGEGLAFEGAGPHVQLVRLAGAGHRRILADERLAEAMRSFLGDSPNAGLAVPTVSKMQVSAQIDTR